MREMLIAWYITIGYRDMISINIFLLQPLDQHMAMYGTHASVSLNKLRFIGFKDISPFNV